MEKVQWPTGKPDFTILPDRFGSLPREEVLKRMRALMENRDVFIQDFRRHFPKTKDRDLLSRPSRRRPRKPSRED